MNTESRWACRMGAIDQPLVVRDSERNGRIYWEYLAGPETQAEIGERYGISTKRVSQIVQRHRERRREVLRFAQRRRDVELWGHVASHTLAWLGLIPASLSSPDT